MRAGTRTGACAIAGTFSRRWSAANSRATGGELAATRAVPFRMPAPGEAIRGTYREAMQLASGRYALVENAQEFTLVPWRPVIERSLGREVVGLVTDGGISWQIGRDRGLGI